MYLTLDNFKEACKRIRPYVVRTPLLEYPGIAKYLKTDHRIFLKLENKQITNTFKARGAYNALLSLTDDQKKRGVITRSSGNFAQAVALAAHTLNIKATIIMPVDAPEIKKHLTKQYDPEIIYGGTTHDEGNALVSKLEKEKLCVKLSPYNQKEVIEGGGTIAIEVYEDLSSIRHFYCPIGGGGLLSGCALAFKQLNPEIETIGVEPTGADDYFQSRKTHKKVAIKAPDTIADGLRANEVGELNRPILDQFVDTVDRVPDKDILRAMKYMKSRYDMVIEPSGATALAALLYNSHPIKGDVVCVISGANVDQNVYEKWMNETKE